MKMLFFVGLLVYATLLDAAPKFSWDNGKGSRDVLTLHEDACTNEKVLAHIRERVPDKEFHDKFKRATLLWDGITYPSCWVEAPSGRVYSVDEAGDFLLPGIPRRMFKESTI